MASQDQVFLELGSDQFARIPLVVTRRQAPFGKKNEFDELASS